MLEVAESIFIYNIQHGGCSIHKKGEKEGKERGAGGNMLSTTCEAHAEGAKGESGSGTGEKGDS